MNCPVGNDFLAWAGQPESSQAFLVGIVERATSENVLVRLPGSFFTTASGMAALPKRWAEEHFRDPRS